MKRRGALQQQPKQAVKSGKMIHVSMGHESMAHPQNLSGRKRMNVAEIEEHRPPSEAKIDQEPGIGKDVIDQPRLNKPGHGHSLSERGGYLRGRQKPCSGSSGR